MAVSGPTLPPHLLSKRKRDGSGHGSSSDTSRSSSPEDASKKRRVMGPAPPPAPLDERPPQDPSGESDSSSGDDDDDGYGPSLPAAAKPGQALEEAVSAYDTDPDATAQMPAEKTKRDDWMMKPPTQDDLKARMDPTKLRARGFNTGKSARGPNSSGGANDTWFETPEEKRKRLEDQILGVSSASSGTAAPKDTRTPAQRAQDEEKARLIQKHNEQNRSQSLYDMRKAAAKKAGDEDKDDDPSKRAFDYEKDMSSAPRVTGAQKRELMHRAADFGSRFSKGSYL